MGHKVELNPKEKLALGDEATKASNLALGVGVLAAGAGIAIGWSDQESLLRSYLTAFMFVLSIGLGALWFIAINHLVNAKWWIVVRRTAEILASQMWVIAILALGIIVPMAIVDTHGHSPIQELYVWLDDAKVHADHLLHHKAPYLNKSFFLMRTAVYFLFWIAISLFFYRNSLAQDELKSKDASVTLQTKLGRASAPVIMGFALTLTFCAFDLLMSLNPVFFSTIFGVYYFAGCVLAGYSTLTLVLHWIQSKGALTTAVNENHYHDLGKMMFAFTIFWAYIGFSQFMLIWYADIPEETHWYEWRFRGEWLNVSISLIVLNFVVPFFGLIHRNIKRNKKTLSFWAVWILVTHFVDLYWLVWPKDDEGAVPFGAVDVLLVVGLVALFFGAVARKAKGVQLVPVKDSRLGQSLAFDNY